MPGIYLLTCEQAVGFTYLVVENRCGKGIILPLLTAAIQ